MKQDNVLKNLKKADIIVATSLNGVIGNKGSIPWKCSGDMQYFKNTTTGGVIIMGRNTYQSIGKALPGRHNIVLSRDADNLRREKYDGKHKDIIFCDNIVSAVKLANSMGKTFIAGGQQIYNLAFEHDLVESIYLTTIHSNFQGDSFFHIPDGWKCSKIIEDNDEYDIKIFRREIES